jgi:MFS family permease
VQAASSPRKNPIPLYALFAANAVSLVGNVFSLIAIPWFVLQTSGSATQTGITGFVAVVPAVLAGFLGGALIDRLRYKRASIISDLASGVTTALIPLLHFTIGLEFWQLLVLVFLGSLLDAPGGTARAALLPDLAEQAGMPIERVTSLTHVIERGSRLVGAPLAGLLIGAIGTENFGEMKDGFHFILRDKLILSIVVMVMLTNFLDTIFWGVVRPVYVKEVFGEALNLGLLTAVNGGGAVIGGLLFAAFGQRMSRHLTFVGAFMLAGMQFWVYALQPSFAVLLVATLITSIGAGPLNPIIGAVEFERIPADMRGRVFGAITAGAWLAVPLGMLLGGVWTESFGTYPLLIGLGVIYFITTLSMAFIPAMKEMNRKIVVPEAAQA